MTAREIEAKATEIVDVQVAACALDINGDNSDARQASQLAALKATFTADAIIQGGDREGRAQDLHDTGIFMYAHVTSVVAAGNADAIWFVAQMSSTYQPLPGEEPTTNPSIAPPVRYSGLALRAQGWKLAAAAVAMDASEPSPARSNPESFPGATAYTPIGDLILDGRMLARALAPDAIVAGIGASAIGRGPSALGPWAGRTLARHPNSREIIGHGWAFVQAVTELDGNAVEVFAVAVPAPSSKPGWTPVLVHYAAD